MRALLRLDDGDAASAVDAVRRTQEELDTRIAIGVSSAGLHSSESFRAGFRRRRTRFSPRPFWETGRPS